ncbi:MAG: hypothetical protein U9R26_02965 [Campylobacterota bacterium]|nr:hypothetical protein [Campylobacterota bacterium]
MIRKISFALGILFAMTPTLVAENIPNPCELLALKEVENVVKVPLKPARLRDDRSHFGGMSCEYFSAKQFEKPGGAKITLDTTSSMKATDSIYESAKKLYDKQKYAVKKALKRQHKEDTFLKMDKLGDDAYWIGNSLRILDGDTYIVIIASGGPKLSAHSSEELDKKVSERKLTLSKELAKLVLERLEQKK